MSDPATVEQAFAELDRLKALDAAVKDWRSKVRNPSTPRAAVLAAERRVEALSR